MNFVNNIVAQVRGSPEILLNTVLLGPSSHSWFQRNGKSQDHEQKRICNIPNHNFLLACLVIVNISNRGNDSVVVADDEKLGVRAQKRMPMSDMRDDRDGWELMSQ